MLKGQDEVNAKLEQEECNVIFCEELWIFNEEKKQLEDDMQKAHMLIIESCCSHSMKTQVEEKDYFDTKVQDEPIELLKRIKEHMCAPTQSKCECDGPHKTMKRFAVDTKQQEEEDLMVHTKRFKQAKDTFEQSVGKEWCKEFVEHTSEYTGTSDVDKQKELMEGGSEKLATMTHMKNSEQRKC